MKTISLSTRLFALAFAAALLLCLATPATAQTSGLGNITGTVTDTTGAVVPNASVVVTDTDTGISRVVTTTSTGTYVATFLQPGHYEIVFGGGGFGKVDRQNLELTVGQILTVDATMPTGSTSAEVTVTSAPAIVDSEKTEVSQTVGEQLISNLPVNARNWSDFVLLTPNVVQDGGSGLVSFHGISGLYNQNYVDGANNNQMLFSEARGRASGAPYVYSVDSIKEFQAQASNYSVEFGQAAGGQVNAITKNGTNAIHGDLFYSLRYPNLNALDPFTKWTAKFNTSNASAAAFLLTQPVHQQQQFGGSVGGPIIKDRLFYFFTYDGFRKVGKALYYNTNTITLTPTAGNSAGTVISPTQCPVVGTTGYTGTTGITATQCNAAISFILANTFGAPTRFSKENLFFPRLDFHINSRNDAFVNYNFSDFDSAYGYAPAPTFSNSSPSTNAPTSYHERFLVAGFTTQIGSRAVNQVHFQFGRDLETAGANSAAPNIGIGTFSYGMINALPRVAEPDEHRTQITDVFSLSHNHHTFKFGGDFNLVHEVMINLFQGGGIYGYSGTNAVQFGSWASDAFAGQVGNTDPYAGYHYNSFVQTVDTKNSIAANRAGADDFYMKMFDGFAEDTWKVAPNVTVNIGVRYDVQLTPAPGVNNTNFPPVSTKYSTSIKNVTDRVQPRIGVSWEPFKGTVVRAGYGLFSALNQGSTYYAMRVENGIVQVNYNYSGCNQSVGTVGSTCAVVPGTGGTAARLQSPNVPFPVPGPALATALHPAGGAAPSVNGPQTLGTQSFHGLDPNFVPPLAHEASLSLEQALPGHMSISVGYVGTRGMRLPVFLDANLVGQTPHGVKSYNILDANNNLVKQLTVPVYLPSDRINPTLTSFNTGFSVANTWYNSLAATVRKPFSNGVEMLLNYTWSRATDTGQVQGNFGTFYGGDTPLDPNNVRGENGLSDIDVRNRFAGSIVYQPKIFMDNKIVKYAFDDFIFSGSVIASAGQPVSLAVNGATIYSVGSPLAAEGGIYGGAMSSSSGLPTNGRPPYIGRNSIVGPGFNNVDFRISRKVPIHEGIYMQFAGEAFNLLNHTVITGVVGTYSTYSTASASTPACSTTASAPTGSVVQGCYAPQSGTGVNAFRATNGTNNGLYGPRQLQVSAKLFF
jgi:hypothetical protein